MKNEKPSTTRLHECSDGKHRNDEQFKAYKNRQELYSKHPEQFVHVDEIVIGALKDHKGSIGVMIGQGARQDLELALTRVNYRALRLGQKQKVGL